MTTPNYPTYAEFCIALMAHDVAAAFRNHVENFMHDRGDYIPIWQYPRAVTAHVKAYRVYNEVVDRMYL